MFTFDCCCDACDGTGIEGEVYNQINEAGEIIATYEKWSDIPDTEDDKDFVKCEKCDGTGEIDIDDQYYESFDDR